MTNVVSLSNRKNLKPESDSERIETVVTNVLLANAELDRVIKDLSKQFDAIENIIASLDDAESRSRLQNSTTLNRESILMAKRQLSKLIGKLIERPGA